MPTETLWDIQQGGNPRFWLGLIVDNRRLFDALQDDWLRPPPTQTGFLLGIGSHMSDQGEADGNRIDVRVQIDTTKLPDLQVAALRDDGWQRMPLSHVAATDDAVFWPGALPLFSVRNLVVSSEEQRVRLISIGKRVSNIELPDVKVDCKDAQARLPLTPSVGVGLGLVVPTEADSIRGAMSMAVWSLPRIDPWLCLFVATLASDTDMLRRRADAVGARWWRHPPWSKTQGFRSADAQECLWMAAADVFGSTDCRGSSEAVDKIAEAAVEYACGEIVGETKSWQRATHKILRSDALIRHDDWRERPVGLAIQLVLSRPEPTAFKTWFEDDQAQLPPGVAWSGAVLCGLWHGYRRLDRRFRGQPVQREVFAVQTMRSCADDGGTGWPGLSSDPPTWRKEGGNFVLTWGGREFACKREQERGKWYASDLQDDRVRQAAIKLAKRLAWPCVTRVVSFKPGVKPLAGSGTLEVGRQVVKARGNVRVQLSPQDTIEEDIEEDAFRHLIVVEPGIIPALPTEQDAVELDDGRPCIPGLTLVRDFLTESEEAQILAAIDASEWSDELQRRVQHYGWRYDYKSRQIDPSMHIGPLPDWANEIARRLIAKGCFRDGLPDQVIVNEYCGNQGIAAHIDSPDSFTDVVAMVSLLDSWEMEFRKKRDNSKVVRKLERRSATILEGEARYEWTHEIPKRKTEPGPVKPGKKKPSRIPRKRRVSLTFRKVIDAARDRPRESVGRG